LWHVHSGLLIGGQRRGFGVDPPRRQQFEARRTGLATVPRPAIVQCSGCCIEFGFKTGC
jgi:hypothetical protein